MIFNYNIVNTKFKRVLTCLKLFYYSLAQIIVVVVFYWKLD